MRTESEIRARLATCEQQINTLTQERENLLRELDETRIEEARLGRVADAKRRDELADKNRRADAAR